MNGQEVFKFAVESPVQSIKQVLSDLDDTIDQMDYILFHQANARIIEAIAGRINIAPEKVVMNIEKFGNTSAASIPLCLSEWEGKFKQGDNIILTAFGAGFTWGALYLKWAYNKV